MKKLAILTTLMTTLGLGSGCLPIGCEIDEYNLLALQTYDCSEDFSQVLYCNAAGEWEITDCAEGTSCVIGAGGETANGDPMGECVAD